jgi:hypothetical protein
MVIAEHLDRLARSGRDTYGVFQDLQALGVEVRTLAQGEVDTAKVGVAALTNAMLLEAISAKTSRALAGVVRDGRAPGRCAYGYRVVHRLDAHGEPIRGLREPDPATAPIVERIYREYAAGASSVKIAQRLNAEGVPSPTGGHWNCVSLRGKAVGGPGILRNPIYNGERVWRASISTKSSNGQRRRRASPEARIMRVPAPEMRLVPEGLWRAVQARLEAAARAPRPEQARRPKRLLSGLMRCGGCGGAMSLAGPDRRFICIGRRDKGPVACPASRSVKAEAAEARIVAALQGQLLHPAVVEASVRELQAESRRRDQQAASRHGQLERELEETSRRADRLVDQVAAGGLSGQAVRARLDQLEARRAELQAALSVAAAARSAEVVRLHPRAAALYRSRVEGLSAALEAADTPEADEVRQLLRQIIRGVVVEPLEARGAYRLHVDGDLSALFETALRTTEGKRPESLRFPNSRLRLRMTA